MFKTVNDQFMGKLSYLRILSGRLANDTTIVNLRSGKTTKTGHIYVMQGKQQEEVAEAIAGDIVAIAKFDDLHVSDTISNVGGNTVVSQLRVKPIKFPIPMVPRAVQPKARDDEAKISAGLAKIADEDPTFSIRRDAQTHELVISGMSDLHLDVIQQRLKHRHKLEMNTHVPQVAYLETISGEAEANHRHKKQTGGRGQFGEVHLRIRPRERGKGFSFVDAVKGGTIPNQFIPACEKGIREQMDKGVISGNQVVDTEVEVYFGKDHPVDSSEQAFKTAAATAFRKAFEQARPALLEPIVNDRRISSGREIRRHLRRPVHPPRPHHRYGFARRQPAGDPRRGSARRSADLCQSAQEHDRRPGLIHHGFQVLRPCARPTSSSKSSRSTRRAAPASKRNKSDRATCSDIPVARAQGTTSTCKLAANRRWSTVLPFALPFACTPFTKYEPCADSPCWLKSSPSVSCSVDTRSGIIQSVILYRIHEPAEREDRDDHERQPGDTGTSRTSPRSGRRPLANTPVSTIPVIPPTPWHGKTSSVSSSVDFVFQWTARLLTTLATSPMTIDSRIVT